MAVNNPGTGQRVQLLTFSGSTYVNAKATITVAGGVPVQTKVKNQELSGGFLVDQDPVTMHGYFEVVTEN